MRAPDGRKGKVLSIRVTDEERELVKKAAAIEAQARGWYYRRRLGQPSVGERIREWALARARELVKGAEQLAGDGSTRASVDAPHGSTVSSKKPAAIGTTARRRAVVPASRPIGMPPVGRRSKHLAKIRID